MKASLFVSGFFGAILASACSQGVDGGLPSPAPPTVFADVGTFAITARDRSRDEPYTAEVSDRRFVRIRFWYPAASAEGDRAGAFLDAREAEANARLFGVPTEIFGKLPTLARHQAPVAQGRWPLLVFSHGARMPVAFYTRFAERLASRGWVVAGVTHTGIASATVLEDGSIVTASAAPNMDMAALVRTISADQRFVATLLIDDTGASATIRAGLEPLAGHLDTSQIAVAGHSIGGAGAARTTVDDARFRAGVNLDGTFDLDTSGEGTSRPFLLVSSEGALARDFSRTGFLQWSTGPRYVLELRGAKHNDFSDIPILIEGTDRDPSDYETGDIDPDVAVEETVHHLAGFLAVHVRGHDHDALPPQQDGASDVVTFRRWT